MNHVVTKTLRPTAEEKFPSLQSKGFIIDHCVGIASSEVLVVRGGVRGSNDLVFVGSAPNIAAKLSELRKSPWRTYVTWQIYNGLRGDCKVTDGTNMWTAVKCTLGNETWSCYKSNWTWAP
jgi:adenylate cyclase